MAIRISVSDGMEIEQKELDCTVDAAAAAEYSAQEQVEELGGISEFPGEIVAKVVSFLPLKDAIRTSVLSTRWRGLWKSADLELEFDASEELQACEDEYLQNEKEEKEKKNKRKWKRNEERLYSSLNARRQRFKNWVNGVILQMQHNASRLSKFRVVFSLNREFNSEGDIDRWLEFAISKRVESLDLDLNISFSDKYEQYVFSDDCYNHIKTPAGLWQIRRLKSLRLSCVDVTGEILEHFIANCTMLEELCVKESNSLTSLRVVGSPLKYLSLENCWLLKSLVIDHAPQLVRLVHDRCYHVKELRVENCPALVCMTVSFGVYYDYSINAVRSLSGCAGQLDSLHLNFSWLLKSLPDVPEFTSLKRLTVHVQIWTLSSMFGLVSFLNVSPALQTLRVFLHLFYRDYDGYPPRHDVVKLRLESIKVVEIVGFRADYLDCEFVKYVMEYFVGLERIVIDCGLGTPSPRGGLCSSKEGACRAEEIALGYKLKAPATLEFIVK